MRLPVLAALAASVALCNRSHETCRVGSVTTEACELTLARGVGVLTVPGRTSVAPLGKNPDGFEIILEDSSLVEVWVTDEPVSAAVAAGSSGIDSLRRADSVVAGHSAALMSAKVQSQKTGQSYYFATATITVDAARALNFLVRTATPRSRDAVLHDVLARWTPAKLRSPSGG